MDEEMSTTETGASERRVFGAVYFLDSGQQASHGIGCVPTNASSFPEQSTRQIVSSGRRNSLFTGARNRGSNSANALAGRNIRTLKSSVTRSIPTNVSTEPLARGSIKAYLRHSKPPSPNAQKPNHSINYQPDRHFGRPDLVESCRRRNL